MNELKLLYDNTTQNLVIEQYNDFHIRVIIGYVRFELLSEEEKIKIIMSEENGLLSFLNDLDTEIDNKTNFVNLLIKVIREEINDYIDYYVPIYRQVNFVNAKVNILLLLTNYRSQLTEEQINALNDLMNKIFALELWVSQVIDKFYECIGQCQNISKYIDVFNALTQLVNNLNSIPKPQLLESRDLGVLYSIFNNLQK